MTNYIVELAFGTLVFLLPLLLLEPDISIWDIVPKVHVYRFHLISQELTWMQLNIGVLTTLTVLFLLFLEIRKRKLDDLVAEVMEVQEATNITLEQERERQAAAGRICARMLNTSAEHYENLALLEQDLRERAKPKHFPPTIQPSINSP